MALQGPSDGIGVIAGLPALLVTGDTGDQALQAARRAQLTMLHKPIRPELLRAVLIRAMGKY